MFYTNGYTPLRSMTLPNGEYECIIRDVQDVQGKYGEYRQVTLQARGKKGWTPNTIFFNPRPQINTYKNNGNPVTEEDLKRWDRQMTTFFDAFGIETGNFDPVSWKGKIGWCKVAEQYDPNEPDKKSKKFKELYPFVKVEEEKNVPEPAPTEELNPGAPEGEMPPDEDIPF